MTDNEEILEKEEEVLESIKKEEAKERELLERIEREEEKIESKEDTIEAEEDTIKRVEEKIEREIEQSKETDRAALIRWKQEIWDNCKYKSEKLSNLAVAFLCNKTGKACTFRECPLAER